MEKFIRDKKLDGKIHLTDENTFVMDNEVRACFVSTMYIIYLLSLLPSTINFIPYHIL